MSALNVEVGEGAGYLFDPPLGSVRYRVGWGGRGGIKSWSFARALLIHAAQRPLRILCAREFQTSIRESVHHLLDEQVGMMGLGGHYKVRESEILGLNGSHIFYAGLRRNIRNLKSTEGIDIVWLEESETLSAESMRVLFPTIRKPGSEIWVTFNTADASDPVYQRFVVNPPPPERALVRRFHFSENPWLSKELREQEAEDRQRDPEAAANVWDGEPWSRSDTQVLSGKWVVEEFTPGKDWDGPYFGADWGFSQDPTVLVKCWRYADKLFIEYDVGGVGLDMDQIAQTFDTVPQAKGHQINGDNARPETINELRRRGWNVVGAPKWSGSVEDGIAHLRDYLQIVIHPRCTRAKTEARLWRYATNAAGEILRQLVDANNHTWDATRYAVGGLIRRRQRPAVLVSGG